jgi:cell division protein FtsB
MRFPVLASLFLLTLSRFLCGQQPITFQQREDLNYERRISKLEAERAALKEDMKAATDNIARLQEGLKTVREQAKSADDLSKTNESRIGEITWVGRGIFGAVLFIMGVMATQFITKFMSSREPRIIKPD